MEGTAELIRRLRGQLVELKAGRRLAKDALAVEQAAQVAYSPADGRKSPTHQAIADRIRALRLPAEPAPICPDCREPMQRGTVYLCAKDGRTV